MNHSFSYKDLNSQQFEYKQYLNEMNKLYDTYIIKNENQLLIA